MTTEELSGLIDLAARDLAMAIIVRQLSRHHLGTAIDIHKRSQIDYEVRATLDELRRRNDVFSDLPNMYVRWEQHQPILYWDRINEAERTRIEEAMQRVFAESVNSSNRYCVQSYA